MMTLPEIAMMRNRHTLTGPMPERTGAPVLPFFPNFRLKYAPFSAIKTLSDPNHRQFTVSERPFNTLMREVERHF